MIPDNLHPLNTLKLFKYKKEFRLLSNLFLKKKYPRISMFSGQKGIGKLTLISHVLAYYFDSKNYDIASNRILPTSDYLKLKNYNVIYINNNSNRIFGIDECRKLKEKLQKSTINNKPRIILVDDVELMNVYSVNSLLKITEEPLNYNYFIFINNFSKEIFDTLKSRCIEFKIRLNNEDNNEIKREILKKHNLEDVLENKFVYLTPGNRLYFNFLINQYKIVVNDNDLIENFKSLTNIYKKEKDLNLQNLIKYLFEIYLYKKEKLKENYSQYIINKNISLFRDLNDYFFYNLNQKITISKINQNIYE